MRPLWQPGPDRVSRSQLTAFTRAVERAEDRAFADYPDLHRWSVSHPGAFWRHMWDHAGIIGDRGSRDVVNLECMPGAEFFPDARLNVAENLLRRRGDSPAIIAATEQGRNIQWSGDELRAQVRRAAAALAKDGVRPGDAVCGIVANTPEAVVVALGAAAIGAVWSGCSPEFGVDGIVDRFGQIRPRVLVSVDGYVYGGKHFDGLSKLAEVHRRLAGVARTIVIPLSGHADAVIPSGAVWWDEWLAGDEGAALEFERFPFNHPLYVLYSSGTTGAPKAIVHGAGGTLLQHVKEHQLHGDIRSGDRVFYFTTCGWMMWHWLVSALASEATIVLYDGSPSHPGPGRLFDLADRARVTFFGTSARFIDAVSKAGLTPSATHDLSSVRTIASTGSPLSPESFDFVYASVKPDVHLTSISGGSDIVSCFVLGNPNGPVWRGEIQAPGLGMDVRVFDAAGRPVEETPGELVCATPFPSMPLRFWNDPGDVQYRAAYFDRFPGVWCHGDWIRTTTHGGFVISGRSDATLNPGGVRIGTAEIYRQVQAIPGVLESLAVGQRWQGDERIVLFVRLVPGVGLDEAMREQIRTRIRTQATPRHVPQRIVAVADLPRTMSGKLVELAVRRVIHGQPVVNRDAIANPESLDLFVDLPELQS